MVQWDNTARRPVGATIFSRGRRPTLYEHWLRSPSASVADVRPEENYLFIVAWNEWAEGNHLEPDQRYGRAFLEATKSRACSTRPARPRPSSKPGPADRPTERPIDLGFDYVYPYQHESAVANAAGLVRDLRLGPRRARSSTSAPAPPSSALPLRWSGPRLSRARVHPAAVELMHDAGIDATDCDLGRPRRRPTGARRARAGRRASCSST